MKSFRNKLSFKYTNSKLLIFALVAVWAFWALSSFSQSPQESQILIETVVGYPTPAEPTEPLEFISSGGFLPLTKIIFKGKAYPHAFLTLLKNDSVVATFFADNLGLFEKDINLWNGGTYDFAIFAEDSRGRQSTTLNFSLDVLRWSKTTVSEIFISPTIEVVPIRAERGSTVNIFGSSFPKSKIHIFISPKEITKETETSLDGEWQYELNTIEFEENNYETKAMALYSNGAQTSFSQNVSFLILPLKVPIYQDVDLVFPEEDLEIIKEPKELCLISSKSHPDQNKWYNRNTLYLHWNLREESLYSYVLSYSPLAKPDNIPDKPKGDLIWIGDMRYDNLEDGIYYFCLRESYETTLGKEGKQIRKWEPKVTFKTMIDTRPPQVFKPEISQDPLIFEGKYFLSFFAQDLTSGISHYEVLETNKEEGTWKVTESPYLLEDQSLRSVIKVKAIDKAGNERITEIIPEVKVFPWWIITIVLIMAGVIWWLWKKYINLNTKDNDE